MLTFMKIISIICLSFLFVFGKDLGINYSFFKEVICGSEEDSEDSDSEDSEDTVEEDSEDSVGESEEFIEEQD